MDCIDAIVELSEKRLGEWKGKYGMAACTDPAAAIRQTIKAGRVRRHRI